MPSDVEQIERTFRAYFTVFQMNNPRAITPYFHNPSLFLTPDGSFVLGSAREAEQFLERLIYSLRQRGYARSVLSTVQVKTLSEELALVNARAERFTREGDLVERTSELFTMRQTDGTWRIATATIYDPEYAFDLR